MSFLKNNKRIVDNLLFSGMLLLCVLSVWQAITIKEMVSKPLTYDDSKNIIQNTEKYSVYLNNFEEENRVISNLFSTKNGKIYQESDTTLLVYNNENVYSYTIPSNAENLNIDFENQISFFDLNNYTYSVFLTDAYLSTESKVVYYLEIEDVKSAYVNLNENTALCIMQNKNDNDDFSDELNQIVISIKDANKVEGYNFVVNDCVEIEGLSICLFVGSSFTLKDESILSVDKQAYKDSLYDKSISTENNLTFKFKSNTSIDEYESYVLKNNSTAIRITTKEPDYLSQFKAYTAPSQDSLSDTNTATENASDSADGLQAEDSVDGKEI